MKMTITLKSLCRYFLVLLGFLILPNHLVAQENVQQDAQRKGHGLSIDLALGTLGDGGSVAYRFSKYFALRGTSRALELTEIGKFTKYGSIFRYDATIEGGGTGVMLDIHPFGKRFFITGGEYDSDFYIHSTAKGTKKGRVPGGIINLNYEVGGNAVLEIDYRGKRPYYGLGWTHRSKGKIGWAARLEFGVIDISEHKVIFDIYDVRLTDNPVNARVQSALDAADPDVRAAVDTTIYELTKIAENQFKKDLRESLKETEKYPVLELTISYQF